MLVAAYPELSTRRLMEDVRDGTVESSSLYLELIDPVAFELLVELMCVRFCVMLASLAVAALITGLCTRTVLQAEPTSHDSQH